MEKYGKISTSWIDFIAALRIKFYPFAYMQKAIMDWHNFRQLKGKFVKRYTQEFSRI